MLLVVASCVFYMAFIPAYILILAVTIAVGSSTQVALVVTPLLVFAGLAFGHHLHLDFTAFDISAIALSVVVVAFVTYDGSTNWLEGVVERIVFDGSTIHLHVETDVGRLLVEVGGSERLELMGGAGSQVRLGFDSLTIIPE